MMKCLLVRGDVDIKSIGKPVAGFDELKSEMAHRKRYAIPFGITGETVPGVRRLMEMERRMMVVMERTEAFMLRHLNAETLCDGFYWDGFYSFDVHWIFNVFLGGFRCPYTYSLLEGE